MFQRLKSINHGCLYGTTTRHDYCQHSTQSPRSSPNFTSFRSVYHTNISNNTSTKSLPCWMIRRKMNLLIRPYHNDDNGPYTLHDDDSYDADADGDEDDWKCYTRFSIGSMSSDSTTDTRKSISSMDKIPKTLRDTNVSHAVTNFTKKDDPIMLNGIDKTIFLQREPHASSSSSINALSSSWSIYVCDDDSHVSHPTTAHQPSTTTIFRLVRKSEPSSALYLHGMEIIHAIDSIYHRDRTVTFTILRQSDDTSEIFVAHGIRDIRTKLYSVMTPSEITFQPRPRQYRHMESDELWDNTMIHDVVSSLIAVGIHDTSMCTSLWQTLSSSSSGSSYSTDNDTDSESEMEMTEI